MRLDESAIRAATLEYCRSDCREFIERYVKIRNLGDGATTVPFSLWPGQRRALVEFENHQINIVLKARQMGLSWLALAYAAWRMWVKPGSAVLVISKNEGASKEMVRRVAFVLRNLPEWMIVKGSSSTGVPAWDNTVTTVTIYHKDEEPSVLMSLPAGEDAGRSFSADMVILDEWAFQAWAEEIWAAVFPTANRPGGKIIGISTIARGSFFEQKWLDSADGKNDFNRIFLPWNTDPTRDAKWYEATKRALGEAAMLAEYPATEEEAFLVPGGAMFPELREPVHSAEDCPTYCNRYRMLDYGMDMLACYWVAVDSAGSATVYREVYKSNLTISEACEAILAENYGDEIIANYAPPDLWNRRQDTGRSAAEIFAEKGIPLYKATNERVNGWIAVHEWLYSKLTKDEQTGEEIVKPMLRIIKSKCPNLWRCLMKIQKDKHNPNDAADQPHELTHAPDALRYFCASRTVPATEVFRSAKDEIGAWSSKEESVTGGEVTEAYMGGWS